MRPQLVVDAGSLEQVVEAIQLSAIDFLTDAEQSSLDWLAPSQLDLLADLQGVAPAGVLVLDDAIGDEDADGPVEPCGRLLTAQLQGRQELGSLSPLLLPWPGDRGLLPLYLVQLAYGLDLAAVGTDGPVRSEYLPRARHRSERQAELACH